MTYTMLHSQIASRTEGLENPTFAERLGYRGPLARPWTPQSVGSQILDARGNSYGTSDRHSPNPTRFQKAAYTLLDPLPVAVGTVSDTPLYVFYAGHNSKFITGGRGDLVSATAFGFKQSSTSVEYGIPAGVTQLLWDDFALVTPNADPTKSIVCPIGGKTLDDLTIVDREPGDVFSSMDDEGVLDVVVTGQPSPYAMESVLVLSNVSGTEAAVYFQVNYEVWCYTSHDCKLGKVRYTDGTPFLLGTHPDLYNRYRWLSKARGILDDDRFLSGQFNIFMGEVKRRENSFPTRVDLRGFREVYGQEVVDAPEFIIPAGGGTQHHFPAGMTHMFYNDYHVIGSRRGSGVSVLLHDTTDPGVVSIREGAYTTTHLAHYGGGPVDLVPASSVEAFGEACRLVGHNWSRGGWAVSIPQPGQYRAYKYA